MFRDFRQGWCFTIFTSCLLGSCQQLLTSAWHVLSSLILPGTHIAVTWQKQMLPTFAGTLQQVVCAAHSVLCSSALVHCHMSVSNPSEHVLPRVWTGTHGPAWLGGHAHSLIPQSWAKLPVASALNVCSGKYFWSLCGYCEGFRWQLLKDASGYPPKPLRRLLCCFLAWTGTCR